MITLLKDQAERAKEFLAKNNQSFVNGYITACSDVLTSVENINSEDRFGVGFHPYFISRLEPTEDLLITPGIIICTNSMIGSSRYYVFAIGIKWLHWNTGFYYMKKLK